MIHFVHIPKTGGVSLREALAGIPGIHSAPHLLKLSDVPDGEDAFTIVRDPVARYISAFWWLAARTLWPWPSPSAMALTIGRSKLTDDAFKRYMVLWPQTHWIDADRPLAWLGHTETLEADAASLGAFLGVTLTLTRRNVGHYPHTSLTPEAEAIIRDFYADDYRLLKELRD